MGTFWDCKTSFVCKSNELEWGRQFVLDELYKTTVELPGTIPADDMAEQSVSVFQCDITSNGRVITLESFGYGIFNPAKMDLPKSLLAIVHSVASTQGEEQDSTIAVQADRVRVADFSPYAELSQAFNFGLEDKAGKKYNELEEDESLDDEEITRLHDEYYDQLIVERSAIHKKLVSKMQHFGLHKGLEPVFESNPELARFTKWLVKALPEWQTDVEELKDIDRNQVEVPYINTELLSLASEEPLPPAELVPDLTEILRQNKAAAEAELKKRREEAAAREAKRQKMLDASIAAARKREAEAMAETSDDDFFETCDGEGDFSPLFRHAEKYKETITKNISTIAETCNEDNPVSVTDEMPEWLIELFKENNVAMC